MIRDCLFLSGDSGITLKIVFRRNRWMHTCSASKLVFEKSILHRQKFISEDLNAVVFYADMDDKELEISNLSVIQQSNKPCWPNPTVLLKMINRHDVLQECLQHNFIDHPIHQTTYYNRHQVNLEYPFVLKCGNTHRGQNKFLIDSKATWEAKDVWDGIATCEPYFVGRSVRALVVGDQTFGLEVQNDSSWIKNSAGTDAFEVLLPKDIIEHAQRCAKHFKLDIAGVDYIIENDGKFHFLEINQFPGLSCYDDSTTNYIEQFFDEKLQKLECA